jgi:hypothetical protein
MQCFANAICYGGANVKIVAGYWRESLTDDEPIACLSDKLCVGGFENLCSEGHLGPKCVSCDI